MYVKHSLLNAQNKKRGQNRERIQLPRPPRLEGQNLRQRRDHQNNYQNNYQNKQNNYQNNQNQNNQNQNNQNLPTAPKIDYSQFSGKPGFIGLSKITTGMTQGVKPNFSIPISGKVPPIGMALNMGMNQVPMMGQPPMMGQKPNQVQPPKQP